MLFVCVFTYPLWFTHSTSSAAFVIIFLKLALEVCRAPVPDNGNSVLESAAFRSKRRYVGKEGRGNQLVWHGATMYYLTTWFPFMKNTYHVTMVLLFLVLPLGPFKLDIPYAVFLRNIFGEIGQGM